MADHMQRIIEMGSTGLDLSPGDPTAAWAANEITQLRASIAQMGREAEQHSQWYAEVREKVSALESENQRLRADAAQLSEWVEPQLVRLGHEMLENDLLKAALRWALECGAKSLYGRLYYHADGLPLTSVTPPPDFAPLIAEATKQEIIA